MYSLVCCGSTVDLDVWGKVINLIMFILEYIARIGKLHGASSSPELKREARDVLFFGGGGQVRIRP